MSLNQLTATTIRLAIAVHRALGPGLLENAYLACLCYELRREEVRFESQRALRLRYGDVSLDCAYRADLIVAGAVLVEVKAVDAIAPIHVRQLHTYVRLAELPVGLLLNFGAATLKDGIKRVVNGFPRE